MLCKQIHGIRNTPIFCIGNCIIYHLHKIRKIAKRKYFRAHKKNFDVCNEYKNLILLFTEFFYFFFQFKKIYKRITHSRNRNYRDSLHTVYKMYILGILYTTLFVYFSDINSHISYV